MGGSYLFFYKQDSLPSGILSNFYFPITFHDETSTRTFTSTEQWMMYHKAQTFNDDWTASEIMKKDPKRAKALGRTVEGFDEAKWDTVKQYVVRQGCYLKFSQNQEARE